MSLTIIEESFVNQCLEHFGGDIAQLDILQEECAELIQACSKVKRLDGHFSYTDPIDKMKEEMAHVLISLEVAARIYGITPADIEAEVMKKAKKYNFKKGDYCE